MGTLPRAPPGKPTCIHTYPLFFGVSSPLCPAEHWVELPVLCSRFSLVIYLSTASVVCSQAFPEPTIGWECRPLGWKDATPAVYPSGRMCARAHASRGTEPASQQRTRWLSLRSRPRPRPGCTLPSPCSLFCPRLGLNTRTLVSSAPRPPLRCPDSGLPSCRKESAPVRFVSSRVREAAVVCASSPLFVILSLPPPVTTVRSPSVFSVLSVSNFWSRNPFKIEDPKEFFIYESCIYGVLIY